MLGEYDIGSFKGLNCDNYNKITRMCVNPKCDKISLFCNDDDCDKCKGEDHAQCLSISLKGVTNILKSMTSEYKDFILSTFEIENQFIAKLQRMRE